MLDFQNNTIDIKELPHFEDVEGHFIDRNYLKVLRIQYVFWMFVLFGGTISLKIWTDIPNLVVYLILGGLFILFLLSGIEMEKGFSKRKFGIREQDIIFQKGFFFFKQTIVPYKRIQHVEIGQGPVFKFFKLFTLKCYTAGSSSGDLSIAGLNHEDADKLKAIILKIAELDED